MGLEYVEVEIYGTARAEGWKILDGTRKEPIGEAREAFPDVEYRYRRYRKMFQRRGDRDGRWDRGFLGDLSALENMLKYAPDDRWIPLGKLLDILEQYGEKRQVCHARLRRLWRKGLIRRLELVEKAGVWYMLQEQELWAKKLESEVSESKVRRILNDIA